MIMTSNKFLSIVLLFSISIITAQKNSDVLFKVSKEPVTILEFKNVYEKNLNLIVDENQKDVKSYLELFINFKLKLNEAKQLKLDTTRAYKREIETYKNQLTAPYLQDSTFLAKMVKDAYYRTKFKINASHILVKVPKDVLPKDTIQFYNKIIKARNEVLNGKSFSEVARKYSDDQSVKNNNGNLGYFTAFKMVYPFENAVYNTKVGELSKPFKTRFGYHFVKVNDLQLSDGEIEVAHILITDKSAVGKQKIDSIYTSLKNGADFKKLVVKYSNDKSSVSNNGVLPKFGVGRMLKSFEDKAFELKEINQLTKPFLTRFGWHVVKLLNKYPVESFEVLKPKIQERVRASGGVRMSDLVVLKRLKNEYKIKVIEESKKVFENKNIRAYKREVLSNTILEINKKEIKQFLFFDYIRNRRHKSIDLLFKEFVNQEVLNYFKDNLSKTEPKFAHTLKEFKEGLIVFDLMQKQVWDKSNKDSIGLSNFFNLNKMKYSFSKLEKNRGLVINDYQKYLEEELINRLKIKYPITIRKRSLQKLIKYYSKNE